MKLQVPRLLWKHMLHRYSCRCLNTLSPLATDFNSKPSRKGSNQIGFKATNVGLFNIPELTCTDGFQVLEKKCLQEVITLVQEACNPQRKRKMVTIFDEMSDSICRVADMMEFVRMSHPEQQFRDAAEKTCLKISELVEKLNTNAPIYEALKHVIENGDVQPLTDVDERVAQLFLFDFEQSGIHLEQHKRERFVNINNALLRLCNNFTHMSQQPTVGMQQSELDKELRRVYEGDPAVVTDLRSEHFSERVREMAYRTYLFPTKHTLDLLSELLQGRKLIASLTGFESFAERALKGTLAETPENVWTFLEAISEDFRRGAEKEYKIMWNLKKEQMQGTDGWSVTTHAIMPWDPPYFTNVCRNKLYNENDISKYFSLGVCMEGLNILFQRLFDITLEIVKAQPGEVWHSDIYKLAVEHKTEGTLGYIYCDLFTREGKPNQDCHFTIRGGRMLESGEYQIPVVVLHLNLSVHGNFTPSLLTPSQLENLFHEFGHAMHSMLGRTHYQHVTGTRCPIDFAEVPSVLMEYFVSDPRVLSSFAKHYKTGEPLEGETLKNFCKSKRMFLYSEYQLQVFYALLDQTYHGVQYASDKIEWTTTEILVEIQNKYYGMQHIENTAFQQRFGHLAGYGAKYYSYLMSRAVASRIWRQFFKDDPFKRENGERYRRELLAHGGERHPSELIEGLLGEKPTIAMLTESLIEDLRQRSISPK